MKDKINILVIDDSPVIPKLVKKSLVGSRYEVVDYADSGFTGVKMYGNIKPDMAFVDITMPDLDGVETVKQILKIDPNAKIIILSATDYSNIKEEFEEMGVKHFVKKPFDSDELLSALNQLIDF